MFLRRVNLPPLSPVSVTAKDTTEVAGAAGGRAGTEGPRLQIQSRSRSGTGPLWQLPEAYAQADSNLGSSWGPAPAQAEGPPGLQGENGMLLLSSHVCLKHVHFPYCGEEMPN